MIEFPFSFQTKKKIILLSLIPYMITFCLLGLLFRTRNKDEQKKKELI